MPSGGACDGFARRKRAPRSATRRGASSSAPSTRSANRSGVRRADVPSARREDSKRSRRLAGGEPAYRSNRSTTRRQPKPPSFLLGSGSAPKGASLVWPRLARKKNRGRTVLCAASLVFLGTPRRAGWPTSPVPGSESAPKGAFLAHLLRAKVKLEVRRDRPELAQCARLQLPHTLPRDPEPRTDLFERLRRLAVEAEPQRDDAAHPRVEARERFRQFLAAQLLRGRVVGTVGMDVLDQVRIHAFAVADRRLERHRILDEIEQLLDSPFCKAALRGELRVRRLAVQLLRELAARAHEAPNLVGHVNGKPNRTSLIGERTRHGLADPPGRVRRELVAHLVVELLDRADQPEIAFLDQIEERDAGLRVVARDRHDEPEVRLDQLLLRLLVALVLPSRELALLSGRQERPVADRADVKL